MHWNPFYVWPIKLKHRPGIIERLDETAAKSSEENKDTEILNAMTNLLCSYSMI